MTEYPTVEELLAKIQNLTLENYYMKDRITALENERNALMTTIRESILREAQSKQPK